jgi:hypothetical protein
VVLLLAHVEDLSEVDDAEKLPAGHGRGDVIERWAERACWGTKPWRL